MSAAPPTVLAALGAATGAAVPWLAGRFTTARPAGSPVAAGPGVGGAAGSGVGSPRLLQSARWRATTGAMVGAVVFGGLGVAPGVGPALPAFLAVATVGLLLAVVDLACLRLPDPLVGAAAFGAVAGLVAAAAVEGRPGRLLGPLAGAALAFTGYALLALLPGSRLGFGDVKLAAVLGLPLGWLGWPTLLAGLVLPHVLHGLAVLGLLAARRVRRDTLLPLGPALLAGAWLAVLFT
ncbi:Type IV leader peptidase family protein [Micromonospora sp. MW-13]|uniref:prepilin peptidase n=1 Tax=unclassified Micromonospora TaxID=2617518 RepID=UPI000EE1B64B|nr:MULTISPECIES: prepilin peptidase [unclassified Micromonospora]MCX4469251.1 prepilin peptidase [Micromonospora sp. NBC_01655]RGC68694.1 Type IV leader peptidase family protein [Micromonospora sp. MW-13]